MQCRITDEQVSSPWDETDDNIDERSLESLSVYDLMGEEFYLHMTRSNSGFKKYELTLEGENNKEIITRDIHPAAIENMARFCTRFIMHYNQLRKRSAA